MQPDNFDKQIREVLTNKHFAYDPAAWEQAAVLLDQKKGKKRGFWWFWSAVGILLIGLIGAIQYSQQLSLAKVDMAVTKPLHEQAFESIPNQEDKLTVQQIESATASPAKLITENQAPTELATAFQRPNEGKINLEIKNSSEKTAALGVDEVPEAAARTFFLQAMRPGLMKRILLISSLSTLEIEAETASFERQKPSNRSLSLGLHAFGGAPLSSIEAAQIFSYGGALFVELRKNKRYFALEPAIHVVKGIGGSFSRSDTSYAFGQVIKTQDLVWTDLLMLQLPVVVGLEVYPKHTLALGMVAQRYLQSNYTIKQTTIQQGFPAEGSSESGGAAHIDNLQIPAVYGLVRYQYQVLNGFSAGLQYHFGSLTGQPQLPSQFQLQLKYHLFNRSR
jgi:hypothetical protein